MCDEARGDGGETVTSSGDAGDDGSDDGDGDGDDDGGEARGGGAAMEARDDDEGDARGSGSACESDGDDSDGQGAPQGGWGVQSTPVSARAAEILRGLRGLEASFMRK